MRRSLTLPTPKGTGKNDLGIRFPHVKGSVAGTSFAAAHCLAVAGWNPSSGLHLSDLAEGERSCR